jgi:hypothetical protein
MYDTRRGAIMAKGRKPVYQSKDEWAVVISLRVPRDLEKQLKGYARIHRQSVTEVVLEGIRMRLETPADPRDMILSDDNTVRHALQEMIRAQVQAEIGKLHTFMGSAFDALKLAPAAEVIPLPGYEVQSSNTVATENVPAPEASAESVPELSHDSNTVVQESASQTEIPPYDETKYMLGKLCKEGHAWGTTGQSLLSLRSQSCKECKNESKRRNRQKAKHQGQSA